MVVHIKSMQDLNHNININNNSYVLKFVSHRCIGCSLLNSIIHDYTKRTIYHIDIDDCAQIADTYQIKKVPTILNVVNSQEDIRLSGFNCIMKWVKCINISDALLTNMKMTI